MTGKEGVFEISKTPSFLAKTVIYLIFTSSSKEEFAEASC